MVRSKLVDRGTETIKVWVAKEAEDKDGNVQLQPHGDPIIRRVTVAEDRQADAELPGQVSNRVVRIVCRDLPGVDSWSLVEFRGQPWELAAPPHFSTGATRASNHVELIIRSRNGLPIEVANG